MRTAGPRTLENIKIVFFKHSLLILGWVAFSELDEDFAIKHLFGAPVKSSLCLRLGDLPAIQKSIKQVSLKVQKVFGRFIVFFLKMQHIFYVVLTPI